MSNLPLSLVQTERNILTLDTEPNDFKNKLEQANNALDSGEADTVVLDGNGQHDVVIDTDESIIRDPDGDMTYTGTTFSKLGGEQEVSLEVGPDRNLDGTTYPISTFKEGDREYTIYEIDTGTEEGSGIQAITETSANSTSEIAHVDNDLDGIEDNTGQPMSFFVPDTYRTTEERLRKMAEDLPE